jgi:hypothetical protein
LENSIKFNLQNVRTLLLNGSVLSEEPLIVRTHGDEEFEIESGKVTTNELNLLIGRLKKGCCFSDIATLLPEQSDENIHALLAELEHNGVIRPVVQARGKAGMEALLEIEDLTNQLLYEKLYRNIFWINCTQASATDDLPEGVVHGMVIENYHFLFRESYFDAPVLSYVPNTRVRLSMNSFFAEEYGHDELLLQALDQIGMSRENLIKTLPLPQTMALCNALSYWAHNDPLFFFTTLGVLEGKDISQDSFLDAAYRVGIDKEFLRPVKEHSDINLKGEHGSLTRKIFSEISIIDQETMRRMRAQTHLFIELYDAFYTAVWQHYSNKKALSRRIDSI